MANDAAPISQQIFGEIGPLIVCDRATMLGPATWQGTKETIMREAEVRETEEAAIELGAVSQATKGGEKAQFEDRDPLTN